MSCCTDATLAPAVRSGVYFCSECLREHRVGEQVRRCHGCCRLFLVDQLRRPRFACCGEVCSDECDQALALSEGRKKQKEAPVRLERAFRCEGCQEMHTTTDPRKIHCSKRCAKRVCTRNYLKRRREREAQAS